MDSATALQSRLIGAILVERNLISDDQLARALELQEETGERLGEIVVAEFGVSRLELAGVLAEQWAELENSEQSAVVERDALQATGHPLSPSEVQIRRPIGEIFVELGFITSQQLDAALDRQRQTGARIGEILVEQGSLSRLDLASALAEQWSALQKLRPPAPVAEPQPWQNGIPAPAPIVESGQEPEARADVTALEERLRVVERAAGASPSLDDLQGVTTELRSAIDAVEARVGAATTDAGDDELREAVDGLSLRLAALERAGEPSDLEEVRREIEELKSRPTTVEGLDELRAAVERLERMPDRAAELDGLAVEIVALTARLDELAGVGELHEKLATVAEQAEVAQTGVAGLSSRVDDLAGLERRLDELATRLVGEDVIDELRRSLADVAAKGDLGAGGVDQSEAIATLVARLDEISGRLDAVVTKPTPDLAPRVDDLEARVEAVTAAIPTGMPSDLSGRIESLENGSRVEHDQLEHLETELRELQARTQQRLDEIDTREPDVAPVDALQSRIDELAGTVARADEVRALEARLDALSTEPTGPDPALVESLRERVDALAEAVARDPDLTPVDALRDRVEELAASVAPSASVDALRERVEELATSAAAAPDSGTVEELRSRVEELASWVAPSASVDALRERVEELAVAAGSDPDRAVVEELRAKVEILAESTAPSESVEALRTWVVELAASVARDPDLTPVDELRERVDALAATAAPRASLDALRTWVVEIAELAAAEPDLTSVDELRARLDELVATIASDPALDTLASRVGDLELRVAEATSAAELRDEVRRVEESTAAERESLAAALFARVEEITAVAPREDELAELRSRLDELAVRPNVDPAVEARVEGLSTRIEGLASVEGGLTELRESLAGLDALRVGDALATGSRLVRLETALESLDGLEERLQARLDADLAERVSERDDFTALAAELRRELEALAARPEIADPSDRLDQLGRRIDGVAQGGQKRIGVLSDQLEARIVELAGELGVRIDGLVSDAGAMLPRDEASAIFVTRDEVSATFVDRELAAAIAAEQAASVRAELQAVRDAGNERAAAHDAAMAESEHARSREQGELHARIDDEITGVRNDLDARGQALSEHAAGEVASVRVEFERHAQALGTRVDAQQVEMESLRLEVQALREAAAGHNAWQDRLEGTLDERLQGLSRLTEESIASARADAQADTAAARAEAEAARAAARGDVEALGARLDEVLALRSADAKDALTANQKLTTRVEALATLREADADAARRAADELSEKLVSLSTSLQQEAADARSAATSIGSQLAELQGWRADDLAAAELAGAELAARLDDHAVRSAAAAFEVEQALREELGGVAARLEERDVQGIEAREELRGELERVVSSVGWRLERIEESLAADDSAELKASLAELERKLEGQSVLSEEQVRVTERALRKGLAALGERLVDNETAYVDAGNALRRSIERLGAAVVEADARMADQIPVSEADGCVAFAPTPSGYRLVELPGTPPELGATLELECSDGPLVVTRYGRSPLPLDGRPCAYLDRA